MEKVTTLYVNDIIMYNESYETMDEFKAYITSLFYSLTIMFDGLNIDSKTHLDTNNYSWKLRVNEYIEICAVLKTTNQTPNILFLEMDWDIYCKSEMTEKYANMIQHMSMVIGRICENIGAYFEYRKQFSELL